MPRANRHFLPGHVWHIIIYTAASSNGSSRSIALLTKNESRSRRSNRSTAMLRSRGIRLVQVPSVSNGLSKRWKTAVLRATIAGLKRSPLAVCLLLRGSKTILASKPCIVARWERESLSQRGFIFASVLNVKLLARRCKRNRRAKLGRRRASSGD
jgi:hypothetical protein